ncbi:MAG: bifunctional ornithine acetyltransferase/N-acetylglutamate synthase [Acutalibacteraceae bacterium]
MQPDYWNALSQGQKQRGCKNSCKICDLFNLLKCAIFGADANWGRVLCAIGYSGANIILMVWMLHLNPNKDVLKYAKTVQVCLLMRILPRKFLEDDIIVAVTLHEGSECATAYGCDLTYDYVKINGDYRS